MAITRVQVFEAANQIVETGETPKLSSVRVKIGRGSNTDLGPFFKEWKEQRKISEIIATPTEPAPQQVLDSLNEVAPQIWACAAKIANEQIQSERQAMELEKTRLAELIAEANELGDQRESELESANKQIETITTEATNAAEIAAADLAKQVAARAEAETKVATFIGTVEAQLIQIKDLSINIEQLHIEGVKQAERAANAELKIVVLTDQIELQNATVNQLSNESARLAERVTIVETKNTELTSQIKLQTDTIDQLRNDSVKLIERATSAETLTSELSAQIVSRNHQAEQHEKTIGELSQEVGKQLERSSAAASKSDELNKEVSALKNTIMQLKEKNKKTLIGSCANASQATESDI